MDQPTMYIQYNLNLVRPCLDNEKEAEELQFVYRFSDPPKSFRARMALLFRAERQTVIFSHLTRQRSGLGFRNVVEMRHSLANNTA